MKPILFSTLMVKAILEGRKTQTRRVVKMPPRKFLFEDGQWKGESGRVYKSPYGEVGDVIWVRETWTDPTPDQSGYPILYKADFPMTYHGTEADPTETITLQEKDYKWKPSLFMPRDACRLFLKIKNIRVERLQDISEEDSVSEGVKKNDWEFEDGECPETYKEGFKFLWESINGEKSWEDNPFVWVIEFEKHNEN
jgi:hypothetical protein